MSTENIYKHWLEVAITGMNESADCFHFRLIIDMLEFSVIDFYDISSAFNERGIL